MEVIGLKEFIDQYDSVETRRAYARDVREFFRLLKPAICDHHPSEATKLHTTDYLNWLKRKKLSAVTIHRKFAALRSYFQFLVDAEIISKNPFRIRHKLPPVQRPLKESLKNSELRQVHEHLKSSLKKHPKSRGWLRDAAIFYMLLYTGMRRSELCRLDVGDYFRGKRNVRMIRIHGKGDRIRVRPLRTHAWKALAAYLKKDGRKKYKAEDPLIVTDKLNRLNPSAVYETISKLGRKAGLKRTLHPHLLRHKFASLAIESGVELTSVQAELGHASVDTTAMYDSSKSDPRRSAALRMKDPLKH